MSWRCTKCNKVIDSGHETLCWKCKLPPTDFPTPPQPEGTPRTDGMTVSVLIDGPNPEAHNTVTVNPSKLGTGRYVEAGFARQLERELALAKTALASAVVNLHAAQRRCEEMEAALEIAINTVECDSLDKDGNPLPWYRAAKKALNQPIKS